MSRLDKKLDTVNNTEKQYGTAFVESSEKNEFLFNQETLESLDELGNIYQNIHKRLLSEGYRIEKGKIYKNEN